MKGPVFLTGLMGSGKTTVGRLLAALLGWDWVDLDRMIEKKSGKKVAQIFRLQGEAAFRRLESKELLALSHHKYCVVSCGGGVVLGAENRRLLGRHLTLYLAAGPGTLARRLQGEQARLRPLLQDQGPRVTLQRLQRERAHFYRVCARFVLRASDRPEAIAKRAFQRVSSTLTP